MAQGGILWIPRPAQDDVRREQVPYYYYQSSSTSPTSIGGMPGNRSLHLIDYTALGEPVPLVFYGRPQRMQVIPLGTVKLVHGAGMIGACKDVIRERQPNVFERKQGMLQCSQSGRLMA